MTIRQLERESWPANVANTRHTVDFRRSWVPSPDMRGPFSLPLPGVRESGSSPSQSGSGVASTSTSTATSGSRPVLPGRAWTYEGAGDEKRRRQEHGDEVTFTRTRARAGEWEREWGREMERDRERARAGEHARARARDQGRQQWEGERQRARETESRRERPRERPRERVRERPTSWLSLFHPKKLFRTSRNATSVDDEHDLEHWGSAVQRDITPGQWRAYGAWARPLIGKPWGMVVRNSTPLDPPRELSPPQVDAMFASLREPDGSQHPQNWIPRVEHHSLPPRPDLWPTPRQTYDPLPGELQLNPFLVHKITGRPPLHFDLRTRVQDILLGERLPIPDTGNRIDAAGPSGSTGAGAGADAVHRPRKVDFWADGPNGSQPATFPGVPRLRITALAEDALPEFPWPVTVLPHHEALPVLVKDVLDALVANLEERMTDEEVDALSGNRRVMLYQAYWRRVRLPIAGRAPSEDDGLRRIDYLGDATYFRGLAPVPDGDGFMLFVGAPP